MSRPARPRDAQAIVVGAGPAGAATAILLAEQGLDVLVLERAKFPRPKICGEYLSPEAGRILDRLGALKILDSTAMPLKGMRITAPDGGVLTGTYRPIGPWRPYREHALAVPRLVLDATLADRLRVLPLDFREQVRVTGLLFDGPDVIGVEARDTENRPLAFRAPLVLGADGRASVVAQRLGCRRPHTLERMALVTYVTGLADCRERGEIFVDPPDYAILNPVAEDRVNLSLVVPLAHAAVFSDRLDRFFTARVKQLRHLPARLAGATPLEPVRAMGPLAYTVVPPRRGGVLLLGDAAGFFDPFTGEGVYRALRQAELATDTAVAALRRGDVSARVLAAYEDRQREEFRAKERVTHLLQHVIRRRWLANAAGRFLSHRPDLLDILMGVIGDFVPPRALLGALAGV